MRVFLVEDDEYLLSQLALVLQPTGFTLECFPSAEAALERARKDPPDILISDFFLTGADGMWLVEEVKKLNPYARMLILSGSPAQARVYAALSSGQLDRFIQKPWDDAFLIQTVTDLGALATTLARLRLKPNRSA